MYKPVSVQVNDNHFEKLLDVNNNSIEEGIAEETKKIDEIKSRNKSYYKIIMQSGLSIITKYGIGMSVLGSGTVVFIGGYIISHYLRIPRIEGGSTPRIEISGKVEDNRTILQLFMDFLRSHIKKQDD